MSLNWESAVYAIIAFAILYWLLNKYAFGPLFGIMEKRRDRVLGDMKSAEESRKEAEKLLNEQKQALEEARKEAYEMIEQSRKVSTKQADEIIAKAKEEAEKIKQEMLKEIENEKNKAVAALKSQVSAMSVMIASKIIEKQIDEKSHQELIENYLQKVGDDK